MPGLEAKKCPLWQKRNFLFDKIFKINNLKSKQIACNFFFESDEIFLKTNSNYTANTSRNKCRANNVYVFIPEKCVELTTFTLHIFNT
jgi:hypothetical protein